MHTGLSRSSHLVLSMSMGLLTGSIGMSAYIAILGLPI